MEIKVNRKDLVESLAIGGSMAGKVKTIPILDMAKCTVGGGSMVISSFNNENAVTKRFKGVECEDSCVFCINPHDLINVLNTLKDDSVVLDIDKEKSICVVNHSRGTLTLPILPAEDFPSPVMDDDSQSVKLDANLLVEWLGKGRNFVGNDERTINITGVYLYIKDGVYGVGSSDSCKLYADYATYPDSSVDVDVILSPRSIGALLSVIEGEEEVVGLFGNSNVTFRTKDAMVTCRKIVGKYPPFQRIIPNGGTTSVKLDVNEFRDSVRRTLISADCKSSMLMFSIKEDTLSISSRNTFDGKEAYDTCPSEIEGSPLDIRLDGNRLIDCLNAIDSSSILMHLTSHERPVLFHDGENPNQSIILMPLVIRA